MVKFIRTHLCPGENYWADIYNLHMNPSDGQMEKSSKSDDFLIFCEKMYKNVLVGINGLIYGTCIANTLQQNIQKILNNGPNH